MSKNVFYQAPDKESGSAQALKEPVITLGFDQKTRSFTYGGSIYDKTNTIYTAIIAPFGYGPKFDSELYNQFNAYLKEADDKKLYNARFAYWKERWKMFEKNIDVDVKKENIDSFIDKIVLGELAYAKKLKNASAKELAEIIGNFPDYVGPGGPVATRIMQGTDVFLLQLFYNKMVGEEQLDDLATSIGITPKNIKTDGACGKETMDAIYILRQFVGSTYAQEDKKKLKNKNIEYSLDGGTWAKIRAYLDVGKKYMGYTVPIKSLEGIVLSQVLDDFDALAKKCKATNDDLKLILMQEKTSLDVAKLDKELRDITEKVKNLGLILNELKTRDTVTIISQITKNKKKVQEYEDKINEIHSQIQEEIKSQEKKIEKEHKKEEMLPYAKDEGAVTEMIKKIPSMTDMKAINKMIEEINESSKNATDPDYKKRLETLRKELVDRVMELATTHEKEKTGGSE